MRTGTSGSTTTCPTTTPYEASSKMDSHTCSTSMGVIHPGQYLTTSSTSVQPWPAWAPAPSLRGCTDRPSPCCALCCPGPTSPPRPAYSTAEQCDTTWSASSSSHQSSPVHTEMYTHTHILHLVWLSNPPPVFDAGLRFDLRLTVHMLEYHSRSNTHLAPLTRDPGLQL